MSCKWNAMRGAILQSKYWRHIYELSECQQALLDLTLILPVTYADAGAVALINISRESLARNSDLVWAYIQYLRDVGARKSINIVCWPDFGFGEYFLVCNFHLYANNMCVPAIFKCYIKIEKTMESKILFDLCRSTTAKLEALWLL